MLCVLQHVTLWWLKLNHHLVHRELQEIFQTKLGIPFLGGGWLKTQIYRALWLMPKLRGSCRPI